MAGISGSMAHLSDGLFTTAIFTYALLPGKKGEPPFKPGARILFQTWRGPQAPPGAAKATELKGQVSVRANEWKDKATTMLRRGEEGSMNAAESVADPYSAAHALPPVNLS